mmetsp:Transcript_13595/g.43870  ORF Transcript_13595/g.43870 Transcript_13595/m.43870 type:complete len:252 (-) Transcript_13595:1327-2082(-)
MNGVNLDATASAKCCTGALLSWASSTSLAIWATALSPPVRSTTTAKARPRFTADAKTAAPRFFLTAANSPVMALSSTWAAPSAPAKAPSSSTSTTRPSAGTASPGSTRATSPLRSASAGTVDAADLAASARKARSSAGTPGSPGGAFSSAWAARAMASPPPRSFASVGRRANNAPTASDVFIFARASRNLPRLTKVMSMAAVSNSKCSWDASKRQQSTRDAHEYAKTSDVAKTTNKSMPRLPTRTPRHAET